MSEAHLTSTRSPRVQALRRLDRRAERASVGRFVVEGPQAVREALPHLLELYVDASLAGSFAELVRGAPCPVTTVTAPVLAAMAGTRSPQGVLGVAPLLDVSLSEALDASPALVAVLESVNDPGNAGTVLRTADAAGAGAVVLTAGSTDVHGPKCVRASAGSLWHLPVVNGVPLEPAVAALRAAGLSVLATTGAPDADDLDELAERGTLAHPTAWLFGNEAGGLGARALELADRRVRIAMRGRAESLNVAAAAAVCLFASARAQRSGSVPPTGGAAVQ